MANEPEQSHEPVTQPLGVLHNVGQPSEVGQPPEAARTRRGQFRAAALLGGALAIAVVSAGVGGGVAATLESHRWPISATTAARTPSAVQSVASTPAGSVEQVAAKVVPAVVELQTRIGGSVAEGSGVILSSDGLILTNNHVVAAAPANGGPGGGAPRTVTFSNGRTVPFTVVGTDPTTDIAVVRAQGVSGLTPITLGTSANLRVGQQVLAVGSPLGLQGTVTSGIVSALSRPVSAGDGSNQNDAFDAIQTDAPINPGNSGGALVNMNGELIGINSAIASVGGGPDSPGGSIGLGFAIPVDQGKRIADELISTGTATHPSLGVEVLSDPSVQGAKVVSVTGGGPAAAAGLPTGAVVTKVDDQPVESGDALVAAVRAKAPGDKMSLTYTEPSGAARTVQVTLGTNPAAQ
jgi:putative serine protease PepD